jgi:hypothetical protein
VETHLSTESTTEDRAADRRESDRVPVSLFVRDVAAGGSFEEHDGNIALGGFYFAGLHPPGGDRIEVRVVLPGTNDEFTAVGEVLRISRDGPKYGVHLRFLEIPLDAELALARWLQKE